MFIGYQIKHEGLSEYSSRINLSRPLLERKEEKTVLTLGTTMYQELTH